MRKGNERKSSSSSPQLDCEVGLGLKMQLQPTDSYSCDGGGSFFSCTTNPPGFANNIYGVADGWFVQRSFHNTASGGMAVSGKALFTASQWQELERQKMIHKYILASIPVPPQLLLPTSSRSPPPSSISQCNTSAGLDLRFSSSGSDPEPWRCKRTDGKKWRCSRDVAPDQKYCERHAHKSRPRSRKLVEVSSHTSSNNTFSQKPLIPPTTNITTTLQPLQRSTSQFPTVTPATSNDQTRCIEWFMKGGSDTNSFSAHKQQQWEQVMQISSSSSRMELNRDNTDHNKNMPVYHSQFEDKQGDFVSLNPYIPDTSNLPRSENQNHLSEGQCCSPIIDSKMKSLTQTRHFIDAWEKEGFDGMRRKGSSKVLISPSSSSLSLSMSGGNYDNDNGDLGIGMMNSERDSDGVLKPQWMNPASWMNSPPGGPLGEALCLGNATTTRGGSNLPSPHGYGYTNSNPNANTNSSSCSKSSCEDGSYALNFIG